MPDVAAVVEHAYQALRPGGQLFVFDMRLLPTGRAWLRLTTRLLRLVYRALAGFTGEDVAAELQHRFDTVEPVHSSGEIGSMVMLALATKATPPNASAHQHPPP